MDAVAEEVGGSGGGWRRRSRGGVFSFNDAHNIIIYHSTCSHARGILASEGSYPAEKVYLARNWY